MNRKVRTTALRVLALLLIVYGLISFSACSVQSRLIYFPTQFKPEVGEIMAKRAGLVPWKNSTGEVIGWKLPAEKTPTGSVLVVHGNAGCALNRGYFASPLHNAASVDIYLLEYPGYGARGGAPSEKSFLAAAEEAFSTLDTNLPVYVVSESLGTGVAAHLAKTQRNRISGMAMFVPYDNFAKLAQAKMPFLPVFLILRDRYNPEDWLREYHGPIQFVLAEKDEVIPIKFGKHLYDAYNGPKNLEVVKGAGHNGVAAKSPEWWKDVFGFWQADSKPTSDAIPRQSKLSAE